MAYQLVYTSAAKLLDAGRSGFGTVARSKSISSLVVSAIERASQFANLRGLDRSRVIHVHRRITAGSSRFHVLTRIVDAGVDYTRRTNHIAHHLVVSQEEASKAAARGVTPADVLRQFPWLDRWEGSARYFDASEDVPLDVFRPDGKNGGAQSWTSVTGNPSHARLLAWDGSPRTGVMIMPDGANPLSLMAEALAECGAQSWTRSFTTSLETTDELADLDWIISTPHTYPDIQPRCGNRNLWDLTAPSTLPVPPAPTLPAPQQAVNRKLPETIAQSTVPRPSGVHSRSPDIAPVKMRSAESETWTDDAPRRATRAQPSNKKNPLMLAGACVSLVAALIIVVVTVAKSGKEEASVKEVSKSKEESNDSAEANKRMDVVALLRDASIYEEEAAKIYDTEGLDKYNYGLCAELIKNLDLIISGAKKPKEWKIDLDPYWELHRKDLKTEWLKALTLSCKDMHEYQKMNENTHFLIKIKKLDSIYDQLKIVAESKKLTRLKLINCDGFVKSMLEYEITDLQKNPEKFQASIEEAVKYEKHKKTSTHHNIVTIARNINDKSNDAQKGKISEILSTIENNANTLKQEVNSSIPKSTQTDAQKNQNQIPPQPAEKTLDTSGLKQFEITLLKEQDKLGEVKSAILGLVLKDDQVLQSPTVSLEIKIDDDSPIEKKSLTNQQKGYYADHYAEPKIKLYKEGKVVVTNSQWNTIEINLKHKNKKYCHFIVVSNHVVKGNKKPVITEELAFGISEVSPDKVEITGQAIESLIGNKLKDQELKFKNKQNMIVKGYLKSIDEPKMIGGKILIGRIPQAEQIIVLNDKDINDLLQVLEKWKKENKEEELKKISTEAFDLLNESIGYYYLQKNNKEWNRESLNQPDSVKKIIKHFKLDNVNKDNVLKDIGKTKIKDAYENVMRKENSAANDRLYTRWEEMENPNNGYSNKLKSLEEFIGHTKKRETGESYKDYLLKCLDQITVETEHRVLFTAKLKQP